MRRRSRLGCFSLGPEDRAARLGLGRKLQRTPPAASAEACGGERQRKNRYMAAGEKRQWRRHAIRPKERPPHYNVEGRKGEGAATGLILAGDCSAAP